MNPSNFSFLKDSEHDSLLFQLAHFAERSFAADPNTCLMKLRQFGEALAQDLALRCRISFNNEISQAELLYSLGQKLQLDHNVKGFFRTLRQEGNKAIHQFKTSHRQVLDGLRVAQVLAIWYHQAFGKAGVKFKVPPFVKPADPSQVHQNLKMEENQELASLTQEKELELVEKLKRDFDVRLQTALKEQEEETSKQKALAAKKTKNLTITATKQLDKRLDAGENEELTHILINTQLIDGGWDADTETIRYSKGARPEPKKNKAIAEWPTTSGPADYVLIPIKKRYWTGF